jgi:sugar phosphate isomerase/epimerase
MRFAIQTILLPGESLAEKFDNAARYGFDGVEIVVSPTFDLKANLTEIKQATAQSGLPACAICTHSIHDPLVPDVAERRKRLTALAELLTLADEIGAGGVVSVPVRPPHVYPDMSPWMDRRQTLMHLLIETLRALVQALPAGNASLFLEPLNRYEAYFLLRVADAVEAAEAVGHPRVKALGDFFHMNIEESDIAEAFYGASAHLGHIHIADNTRFQPGRGCMNFAPSFKALADMGYQGFISIECWTPRGAVIAGDPEIALPETVRFLHALRDEAKASS